MARFTTRQVDVRVPAVGISLEGTELTDLECLGCGAALAVHQPENGFPDRMLGTCESCHTWYLWDFHADTNRAVMVSLPDHGFFKEAVARLGG